MKKFTDITSQQKRDSQKTGMNKMDSQTDLVHPLHCIYVLYFQSLSKLDLLPVPHLVNRNSTPAVHVSPIDTCPLVPTTPSLGLYGLFLKLSIRDLLLGAFLEIKLTFSK